MRSYTAIGETLLQMIRGDNMRRNTGEPKLLIKFPTRGRPQKFFYVLTLYYRFMRGKHYEFVISCDEDDETMNNEMIRNHFKQFPNLSVHYSKNANKVEAINANMEGRDFDILLLASDDMIPEIPGYDAHIKNTMLQTFPDGDGVLWFFDGHRKDINTLSIFGKKYYDRFGYIYNPEYKTWFCDNEFTAVGHGLRRQATIETVIIRHCHPDIAGYGHDKTYERNNDSDEKKEDNRIYLARKSRDFDIPQLLADEQKRISSGHSPVAPPKKPKNKSRKSSKKRRKGKKR